MCRFSPSSRAPRLLETLRFSHERADDHHGGEPMQRFALCLAVGLAATGMLFAQSDSSTEAAKEAESPIAWTAGPAVGSLGEMATVKVPEGFLFADGDGTRIFLKLTQNPSSGRELGMLFAAREQGGPRYFVIFEFDDVGFVKDDERDKLDADGTLASLREGTDEGNEFRKQQGWETLEIVGWEKSPFYDPKTNNLTWATRLRGQSGGESVNWSTRLLGRRGVMNVDLVLDPTDLTVALPEFETTLDSFEYSAGHRYREWSKGDKVAAFGLGALMLGGAGAVAAKLGLLGKFWKLILVAWKWIAIAVIGSFSALRRFFKRSSGRAREGSEESFASPPPPPPPPPVSSEPLT